MEFSRLEKRLKGLEHEIKQVERMRGIFFTFLSKKEK